MTNNFSTIFGAILLAKEVKDMFGKTQEVKFTLVDGVPTAIASTTEKGMIAGALGHVISHLTEDTVVIGAGRTIGAAAMVYAPMVLVNQQLTGSLRFNPFARG